MLTLCTLTALLLSGCMGSGSGLLNDDSATFTVHGETAEMRGMIDRDTSSALLDIMSENFDVHEISLVQATGSSGYREMREASRMLSEYHLATHVPANGFVSPGAIDFFIAGWKRTVEEGAQLAVGSWFDGAHYGVDLPRHNSLHFGYLKWYREHGIPEDFYWFSLTAAPKGQQHILTRDEMLRFNIITE